MGIDAEERLSLLVSHWSRWSSLQTQPRRPLCKCRDVRVCPFLCSRAIPTLEILHSPKENERSSRGEERRPTFDATRGVISGEKLSVVEDVVEQSFDGNGIRSID